MDILFDESDGIEVALPPDVHGVYGRLRLPSTRPYVVSNFVATIDGVVSLDVPGGSPRLISGGNFEDRLIMAMLRATADIVLIGEGTLAAEPDHVWTPEHICPELGAAFGARSPLLAVVSSDGQVDFRSAVFTAPGARCVIVTTEQGAARLQPQLPASARLLVAGTAAPLSGAAILTALACPGALVLTEGGPLLHGLLIKDGLVDELFLTIAPQLAGRESERDRFGLVRGAVFAPHCPRWAKLTSARRAGDFLYLRYAFMRSGVS